MLFRCSQCEKTCMQSCAIDSRQRLFRCSHREKKLSVNLAEICHEIIWSVKVGVHQRDQWYLPLAKPWFNSICCILGAGVSSRAHRKCAVLTGGIFTYEDIGQGGFANSCCTKDDDVRKLKLFNGIIFWKRSWGSGCWYEDQWQKEATNVHCDRSNQNKINADIYWWKTVNLDYV